MNQEWVGFLSSGESNARYTDKIVEHWRDKTRCAAGVGSVGGEILIDLPRLIMIEYDSGGVYTVVREDMLR